MINHILNLKKLKLNYKIALISIAALFLLILFLVQKKIFFLFIFTTLSIVLSIVIGFVPPLKIVGIELVTFSTILTGRFFGPAIGAVFGVCLLTIHLIASRYNGGPYLVWTIPSYALIGILSGFLTDVKMLVAMIIGVVILDNLLTLAFFKENYMKTVIFSIGNLIFNIILLLNFFQLIIGLI
jgi:hypothetical protein